jgi:hypothetical protein
MPSETANTADLFEIIRTTRSMRRLKPDTVPQDPRSGRLCSEWRKHAALVVPGNP